MSSRFTRKSDFCAGTFDIRFASVRRRDSYTSCTPGTDPRRLRERRMLRQPTSRNVLGRRSAIQVGNVLKVNLYLYFNITTTVRCTRKILAFRLSSICYCFLLCNISFYFIFVRQQSILIHRSLAATTPVRRLTGRDVIDDVIIERILKQRAV